MTKGLLLVAAATALTSMLAACGSSDGDARATATVTVTETVTPEAVETSTPEASASTTESENPFTPNIGDSALAVGETRVGTDFRTTVHEVVVPYPPGQYREPAKGNDFLGIRIEQCLDEDVTERRKSTMAFEWAAVTPEGSEYSTSGSSWTDWPAPRFPEDVQMIPGRCNNGWIAWEVPEGTKVASILYRDFNSGTAVAEWLLKR